MQLYGSISYFKVKTEKGNLMLLSAGNFLKVTASTDQYQRKYTETKIQKNSHFSITRLGKKRKLPMQKPIETIIVRAQQNFDVVGGLNPVQIEIEDDRILNALKKYKNVIYRITPLGLLFPASVTNDTKQIFVTCRELTDLKKEKYMVYYQL